MNKELIIRVDNFGVYENSWITVSKFSQADQLYYEVRGESCCGQGEWSVMNDTCTDLNSVRMSVEYAVSRAFPILSSKENQGEIKGELINSILNICRLTKK